MNLLHSLTNSFMELLPSVPGIAFVELYIHSWLPATVRIEPERMDFRTIQYGLNELGFVGEDQNKED